MSLVRGALGPFERLPELRRATPEDFDQVHESGARLRAEELEEDPRTADAAGFAKRVEDECRGRLHPRVDRGRRAVLPLQRERDDAGCGAGVGVYTPPERRNRGLARRAPVRAVHAAVRSQPHRVPVRERLQRARAGVVSTPGFKTLADWASAFYDVPR